MADPTETTAITIADESEKFFAERLAAANRQIESHLFGPNARLRRGMEFPDPTPATDLPKPTAAVLEPSEGPDAAYAALSQKLGIYCVQEAEARLEAVLREEMIPVCNNQAVEEYLDNECRKVQNETVSNGPSFWTPSVVWSWRPVRKVDRLKGSGPGHIANRVYQKPIPYPVLLTMEHIASRMPEAKFFVSEIVSVPDPFLMVTVKGSDRVWVVERWDCPNFRVR